MDNSEKIKNCKTILSFIINGFVIDGNEVPGLSDLSDVDNKMLYIAVAMFCANNNFVITTDGDIDIKPMSGGSNDIEIINSIVANPYDIERVTISVKPKNSKLMIYRFIFILLLILNTALGLRIMYYLFEHTSKEKYTIMSNSKERLVTLVKNYPSEALMLDYEHVLKLMNEYNSLTREIEQTSTDIVATGFTDNISQQYNKLKSLKLTRQLQLENIPELKNPDMITLDGLISPIKGILNIYRSSINYIVKLRESKIEELLYNNEIYQKIQLEYQNTREITEDMLKQYTDFMNAVKKDGNQIQQKITQPVMQTLTDTLSGFVSGFFTTSESSTVDIARAKYYLLQEIILVWTRIMATAPSETFNVMNAITIFYSNIFNMTGIIQEQVYISCALFSFFKFIIFLIYTRFIEKKITIKDYNKISKKIDTIVQETVNEYFDRYNIDKTDALIILTDIFIQKFYDNIMDPNSGLIDYGSDVRETIQTNKEDIRKYILSSIDKIVMDHSRDDILSNMFNIIFGKNNIFGEKELANINKLLTIIYKEETNMVSERLQIEKEQKQTNEKKLKKLEKLEG